jgi:hypothetical protein
MLLQLRRSPQPASNLLFPLWQKSSSYSYFLFVSLF